MKFYCNTCLFFTCCLCLLWALRARWNSYHRIRIWFINLIYCTSIEEFAPPVLQPGCFIISHNSVVASWALFQLPFCGSVGSTCDNLTAWLGIRGQDGLTHTSGCRWLVSAGVLYFISVSLALPPLLGRLSFFIVWWLCYKYQCRNAKLELIQHHLHVLFIEITPLGNPRSMGG